MAEYLLIAVAREDADVAGITEHAAVESFVNEKGEIVIRPLTDVEDYVCGQDCGACIFDKRSCGKKKRPEPYICRCRAVNPDTEGGAGLDGHKDIPDKPGAR